MLLFLKRKYKIQHITWSPFTRKRCQKELCLDAPTESHLKELFFTSFHIYALKFSIMSVYMDNGQGNPTESSILGNFLFYGWISTGFHLSAQCSHCGTISLLYRFLTVFFSHSFSAQILSFHRKWCWRRRQHPTPVLLLGKSHGWRSLVGCSPWGREESDTTERLHFHFSPSCLGEGNGNPLQCSCLKNPRDGGAWWAAIYGVAQSWTRLNRLSSNSSSGKWCSWYS